MTELNFSILSFVSDIEKLKKDCIESIKYNYEFLDESISKLTDTKIEDIVIEHFYDYRDEQVYEYVPYTTIKTLIDEM